MRYAVKLVLGSLFGGYLMVIAASAIISRTSIYQDWCPIVCHDPGKEWTYTRLPFGGERTLSVWGTAAQIRAERQISVGTIEREGGR